MVESEITMSESASSFLRVTGYWFSMGALPQLAKGLPPIYQVAFLLFGHNHASGFFSA